MAQAEDRARYEAAVRALSRDAESLLADGQSPEAVASEMVSRRNALKQTFRAGVDPVVLAAIESRNLARYRDPVGPTLAMLFERYGNWRGVIDAACRPADLSKIADGRKLKP